MATYCLDGKNHKETQKNERHVETCAAQELSLSHTMRLLMLMGLHGI